MNKEELLQDYFDGELSPEEEREALHLFAEDPEMRSMLRFEQKLRSVFTELPRPENFEVPSGFSDHVMHQIEQKKADERQSIIEKVQSWLERMLNPRYLRLRPVYAFGTVILLFASLLFPLYLITEEQQELIDSKSLTRSVQQVSETTEQVWLRFVYIDKSAESVAVAGDFSDWELIPLTKQEINGEQVWTGLISMTRGEHRYMFVKDGEKWVTDPLAPVHREDGFGNKNAVIYI